MNTPQSDYQWGTGYWSDDDAAMDTFSVRVPRQSPASVMPAQIHQARQFGYPPDGLMLAPNTPASSKRSG